jgi:hypothetical protein
MSPWISNHEGHLQYIISLSLYFCCYFLHAILVHSTPPYRHLGLDIWLGAANVFLQLQQVRRELDVVLEVILRIKVV